MKVERCTMEPFSVIGKEVLADNDMEIVKKLWDEANGSFSEIQDLALKDDDGNMAGIWGAMSDTYRNFMPWENNFTKGYYLAGVQVERNTKAPEGWTKWTIPSFEYLYTKVEGDYGEAFSYVLNYIKDNNLFLEGAVQEYYCPEENGQLYLFFPIKRIEVFESYCGILCNECEFRQTLNCMGCKETKGNPFHGECKIAKCVINRGINSCGECEKFLCEDLVSYTNDEEHGDNPKGARVEMCKEGKRILVARARNGISPISFCGHHCDHCFLGQWCGGCRSDYNCCSYATICEDKTCPNVKCCNEKNLKGCFECDELISCEKGYYSNENEYVAKATALFIKKYGEETYSKTLQKAIDDGLDYPKSFDGTGSVEKALELLEKYLK